MTPQRFTAARRVPWKAILPGLLLAVLPAWRAQAQALPPEDVVRNVLLDSPQLRVAQELIARGEARNRLLRAGPHEWEAVAMSQQRTDPAGIRYDEQEYGLQRAVRWPWKATLDRRIGAQARAVGEFGFEDALA